MSFTRVFKNTLKNILQERFQLFDVSAYSGASESYVDEDS